MQEGLHQVGAYPNIQLVKSLVILPNEDNDDGDGNGDDDDNDDDDNDPGYLVEATTGVDGAPLRPPQVL